MFEILVTQDSVAPAAPTIPAAPADLTATSDSDSIGLEWTNGDTYSAVVIMRKTNGDYSALATIAGDQESYDDTTAVVDTTYTYKVRGVKNSFPSLYSNEDSATVTVSTSAAAGFDGTTAYLTAVDPASIRISNTDSIIIGMWIKCTNLNTFPVILQKNDAVAQTYAVETTGDTDAVVVDVQFRVASDLKKIVFSDEVIAPNTKTFVLAWKNPTTKTLNVKINAQTADSYDYTADEGSFTSTAGDLFIGTDDGALALPFAGSIDEAFICVSPANLATALTTIATTIYNAGTGIRYAGLTAQQKTDIGLVSWWGLDEASGTREDLHGSVDLTPQGGVTQGTALVA